MHLLFRRSRSHILTALLLILVFILGTSLGWLNNHVITEDHRFETFTRELFQKEVSGNMLNLHYSLAYPEKKGITRPAPILGTLSLPSEISSEDKTFSEEMLHTLQSFCSSKLSADNQITLDMLLLYFQTECISQDCPYLYEPLSPSLGIQAQLPVLLAEYAFYQEQDIADYLNLLISIDSYFESILAYEQEKSQAGFFMSDTTLQRILEQCSAFIQNPDSNYLLEIFSEKIKNFGTISEEDQKILNQRHKEIVIRKVIPAYQKLIVGLKSLQGAGRPSQGLAHLKNGQTYYQYLLRSQTGTFLSVKKIQKRITEQLTADMKAVQELLKKNPSLLEKLEDPPALSLSVPADILHTLSQDMQNDFPILTDTEYEVRYVHKSMENYLSPAFYLTPPLDTRTPNVIYINPADQSSNLELFTTLAHEGFPGHLYQTVFFGNTQPDDIRYLLTSSGYIEGWATYVESYGYQYAAKYLDDPDASAYVRLAWLNRSVNLCICSLLDIGIHYYGWDQNQTAGFLRAFGITNEQTISEMFQYIVETPANYLKYYLGYLNFLDLKKEWQDTLGEHFDAKTFHQNLLKIGPVQVPVLQKYMRQRLSESKQSNLTNEKGGAIRTSCLICVAFKKVLQL